MKFLVVVPLLISAIFAADLGHVVDTKVGPALPQGSQVIGQEQGQAKISQSVIPGPTQVSSQQGPTRVSEQVVGGTPAVSHYKNTHATQINTEHRRTDYIHTRKETPVTTLTQTRHYQPESHITQHHSSSRSTSLRQIPQISSHRTTERKSELITRVNPLNHGDDGHGAVIADAGIAGHSAAANLAAANLAGHGIAGHSISAGHAIASH